MRSYKEGKKHLGWSSPAKPALMTPEPYNRNAKSKVRKERVRVRLNCSGTPAVMVDVAAEIDSS
jgi:hypothetical protein